MPREMKTRAILPILFACLIPQVSCANSMAPIFPLLSFTGWFALPLIILIEGVFYSRKSLPHPYKLSIYSNLVSALVGIGLAVVTFPVMLGPSIDPYLDVILMGSLATVAGIIFHWWFSSYIEHRFAQRHKLWKAESISRRVFFQANGITYAIITMYLSYMLLNQMKEYRERHNNPSHHTAESRAGARLPAAGER